MRSDRHTQRYAKKKEQVIKLRKASRLSERLDLSPEPTSTELRHRRRSTEISPREKPMRQHSKSLSIEQEKEPNRISLAVKIPKPRGVDLHEQFSLPRSVDHSDREGIPKNEEHVLCEAIPLQSFSSGKSSIFKLRGARPRFVFNGRTLESVKVNDKLIRKMWQTSSSFSPSSSPVYNTLSKSSKTVHKYSTPFNLEELTLRQAYENDSSVEFIRKSPSLRKVDEMSESFKFTSLPASLDSRFSDWQYQFTTNDTDSDTARTPSEQRSSSTTCWSSTINSQIQNKPQEKPSLTTFKLNELPLPVPPEGMVFVAWVNVSQGYRFKTWPLSIKLQKVRAWLGEPLPIVVHEPGKRGRRCKDDVTLAQAAGTLLKNPYKQGIAFFVGPVNGTLSYSMKVSDLDRLSALMTTKDDEKKVTRATWL